MIRVYDEKSNVLCQLSEAMIDDAGVMSLPTVIMIGAVLGGLEGATIFFEPREPYKWQILCAATLGGVLVALLTAFSVTVDTLVVRDGHRRVMDSPLLLWFISRKADGRRVIGVIRGGITGLLVVMWAIKTI